MRNRPKRGSNNGILGSPGPFRAKASSSMAFDQSMSRRASTSFSALWMCRQEGLDGRIGRGLGETPYRYFRIWSAPSVLSLRTSGYRDLLATLQEKQLEAPKSVGHSEIKRAWVYLEAGLLLRTNAPVAHAVMKARRKSLRAALGAQSAKSKPMPRPASTEESSSSESTSCASHPKAAGYYGKP